MRNSQIKYCDVYVALPEQGTGTSQSSESGAHTWAMRHLAQPEDVRLLFSRKNGVTMTDAERVCYQIERITSLRQGAERSFLLQQLAADPALGRLVWECFPVGVALSHPLEVRRIVPGEP